MTTKIEGLPDGYEAVRWGPPKCGEEYMNSQGDLDVTTFDFDVDSKRLIVRKIPAKVEPKQTIEDCVAQKSTPAANARYHALDVMRQAEVERAKAREEDSKPEQLAIDPGKGWRLLKVDEPIQ